MKINVDYNGLTIEAAKTDLPFAVADTAAGISLMLPHKTFRLLEEIFARVRDGQKALGPIEFRFEFFKGGKL